ncbi:hypothetical protein R3P38DRAFT_3122835 [Favolaschia claudopus]|uniref:DUF6533 domain-containing protein n=1 Tax=Favolaschia claudopus TaxID=2862362 RepID=A0AAV9ZCT9_9AGAR
MSAAELEAAITGLQNLLITRYLLLYDHLLTLDVEIEYIWSAPNSAAKVLFLILRYMVPIFLTSQTILRSGLSIVYICKGWISFGAYAGWLSIVISNFIVLLRIWTTLPHSHRLRLWSILIFIIAQLGSLGMTTWAVSNMIPVLIFDSRVGLCSFTSKPNVFGLWIVGLVYEVLVFVTVCWNTLDRPRAVGSTPDAALTRIFLRDGAVYFVVPLRIANTVIAIISPISSLFPLRHSILHLGRNNPHHKPSHPQLNSRRSAGQASGLLVMPDCEPECAVTVSEGSFCGSGRVISEWWPDPKREV